MARSTRSQRRATDPLFHSLSPAGRIHLCAGIFFTFATIGPLLTLGRMGEHDPWWATAAWSAFSGIVAVGWAIAFMWRMWVLPAVIILQIVAPPLLGASAGAGWRFDSYRSLIAGLALAFMVLGYVLSAWFLQKEGARRLRLQAEIELAQGIHDRLVPDVRFESAAMEVVGGSEASSEMGGDLLDVVEHEGGVDVLLADVSGHGVRAGVVMAMVKSAARVRLLDPCGLSKLFDDLNRSLAALVEPGMFVTGAAVRRLRTGELEIALAGHLPILHWRAATGEIVEIHNERLPLCVDADERYESRRVAAAPGDLLALFTDGLTETADASGAQFGISGVRAAVTAGAGGPLPALHASILAAVRAHGPRRDDQTLLLVRLN